eukprot:SAG11_NODE_1946_length_4019_cov_1.215306_2_plen_178_part_00
MADALPLLLCHSAHLLPPFTRTTIFYLTHMLFAWIQIVLNMSETLTPAKRKPFKWANANPFGSVACLFNHGPGLRAPLPRLVRTATQPVPVSLCRTIKTQLRSSNCHLESQIYVHRELYIHLEEQLYRKSSSDKAGGRAPWRDRQTAKAAGAELIHSCWPWPWRALLCKPCHLQGGS